MPPVMLNAGPPLIEIVLPWFHSESSTALVLGKSNYIKLEYNIYLKTILTFDVLEKLLILVPE